MTGPSVAVDAEALNVEGKFDGWTLAENAATGA
jgi:hypothetical protein